MKMRKIERIIFETKHLEKDARIQALQHKGVQKKDAALIVNNIEKNERR